MATNHHDTGYKELFSYPEFVQQLIEGFAPSEISGLMDFSTLQNHSGNYITPLFEEKFELDALRGLLLRPPPQDHRGHPKPRTATDPAYCALQRVSALDG